MLEAEERDNEEKGKICVQKYIISYLPRFSVDRGTFDVYTNILFCDIK